MKTIDALTRVLGRSHKLVVSLAALGLIFLGESASAGTLLQEYFPLHVGDHYTALTALGTNTIMIQAGVARYSGSFAVVTVSPISGVESTNVAYIGYSGDSEVTYEVDNGTNSAEVLAPPLVTMTESALASLGTQFTGTSWYTNSLQVGGQSLDIVVSETISGVVSSTGTVTVVAGTFNNCRANSETITTTTTTTLGFSSTNTLNQTLFYAPNVGCIKVVQGGTNVYELLGGVVGGVTIGGGGGGDTQKPTVHITSPANGASVTTNSVAVQGTASDNVGVVAVYCQVDGGSWSTAQGTDNWSFQASLSPGSNVIEAYAADAAGNLSTTDKVSVTYAAQAASGVLHLQTNGLGSITGNFKGNTLPVGKTYTVTAVPAAGQVFAGWTGDIQSNQNPLTFKMQATLTLQANFKVNPFAALKGTYNGLFYGTNVVAPTNSGAFTITLTDKGSYSGKLWLGGGSLSMLGSFNAQGVAQQSITRPKQRLCGG